MNPNETRTLWISIGAALFAVFLMYSYSQEKKAEYDRRYGTKKTVVIAKADISQMETIDVSQLDTVEKPVDFVEPGSFVDPEDIIGQVAAIPITAGAQILESQLYTVGPDTGIANQVSPGKRAVSIPVDEVRAGSKLLKPGDRIDVLAALDVGKGQNAERKIKTVLQDVTVLSTGKQVLNNIPRLRRTDGDKEYYEQLVSDLSFSTVNIEVDPKQAQDIIFILSTSASVFVTVRNPNDRLLKTLPPSDLNTVMGKVFKPRVQRKIRTPSSVPPTPPPTPIRPKKKKLFKEI